MTTDFECQLEQMIPLVRESFICRTPAKPMRCESHIMSFTKIALGFALGMFVTYHAMLPSDLSSPSPTKTYMVKFDESALHEVRCPADIFRCTVRVPIPKNKYKQGSYRELRGQVLLDKET